MSSRGGLSLVELLVAIVLLGVMGALLSRSTVHLNRVTSRLLSRSVAQQTLDQGANWLASELSEIGPGDLRAIAAESVRYRGYRAAGLACLVTASEVRVLRAGLTSWRDPQPARDTLLLLTGRAGDSAWVAQPILAAGASDCGGRPALRLGTVTDSTTLDTLPGPLVPVRLFESMQARLYLASGEWWLGARSESAAEAIQPLAGPFAPAGLRLSFHDATLLPVTAPAAVRQLGLRLTTDTPLADSAAQWLAPRNFAP